MLATWVAASFLWTERFGSRTALVVWYCLQCVEFFSMFVRAAAHLRLQDDDVASAACAVPPRPRPALCPHDALSLDITDDWNDWRHCEE